MVDISEATEQLIHNANKFVAGSPEVKNREELYQTIVKLAHSIAGSLGVTVEFFEERRTLKREENGGFRKGYVLLEKVLPIGNGASQTKVVRDDESDTASGAQQTIAETSPEGIRPVVPKLVRDNIPAIIEKQARRNWEILCGETASAEGVTLDEAKRRAHRLKDYKAKIRVAGRQEVYKFLRDKLREEATELRTSLETEDRLEDLGDILEIVDAYRFYRQGNN